jgi:hypothetical protein
MDKNDIFINSLWEDSSFIDHDEDWDEPPPTDFVPTDFVPTDLSEEEWEETPPDSDEDDTNHNLPSVDEDWDEPPPDSSSEDWGDGDYCSLPPPDDDSFDEAHDGDTLSIDEDWDEPPPPNSDSENNDLPPPDMPDDDGLAEEPPLDDEWSDLPPADSPLLLHSTEDCEELLVSEPGVQLSDLSLGGTNQPIGMCWENVVDARGPSVSARVGTDFDSTEKRGRYDEHGEGAPSAVATVLFSHPSTAPPPPPPPKDSRSLQRGEVSATPAATIAATPSMRPPPSLAAVFGARSEQSSPSLTSQAPPPFAHESPSEFSSQPDLAISSEHVKAGEHPEYAKYFKMLKVGMPIAAVKIKMSQEGVDPAVIDKAPTDLILLTSEQVKAGEHPEYAKYFKMLKVGMPIAAVKIKMSQEGVDPAVIDKAPTDLIPVRVAPHPQSKVIRGGGGGGACVKVPVKRKRLHVRGSVCVGRGSVWASGSDGGEGEGQTQPKGEEGAADSGGGGDIDVDVEELNRMFSETK